MSQQVAVFQVLFLVAKHFLWMSDRRFLEFQVSACTQTWPIEIFLRHWHHCYQQWKNFFWTKHDRNIKTICLRQSDNYWICYDMTGADPPYCLKLSSCFCATKIWRRLYGLLEESIALIRFEPHFWEHSFCTLIVLFRCSVELAEPETPRFQSFIHYRLSLLWCMVVTFFWNPYQSLQIVQHRITRCLKVSPEHLRREQMHFTLMNLCQMPDMNWNLLWLET